MMRRLHDLGWGTRRIAVEVGCNRETVQRYLAAGAWTPCRVPTRLRLLAGQVAWLSERLRRHRGNADVVRQELASELVGQRSLCSPSGRFIGLVQRPGRRSGQQAQAVRHNSVPGR
jgi:hypothetical protein